MLPELRAIRADEQAEPTAIAELIFLISRFCLRNYNSVECRGDPKSRNAGKSRANWALDPLFCHQRPPIDGERGRTLAVKSGVKMAVFRGFSNHRRSLLNG
jgi:hypothetical protein